MMANVWISLAIVLATQAVLNSGQGLRIAIKKAPYYEKKLERLSKECQDCKPELCHKVDDCVAGLALDECGCCKVCAQREGDVCDHPDAPAAAVKVGCGENLECRLRDDLENGDEQQALCYCKSEEVLCGSDENTYSNICQLKSATTGGKNVKIQHMGPCKTAPWIVTPPENVRNASGTDVFLSCEAKGYPIPTIEWTVTDASRDTVYLPSDDLHISVNSRGGPSKYMVTGWLQIVNLQEKHQGDYACLAQNDLGIVSATARVNIDRKGEL